MNTNGSKPGLILAVVGASLGLIGLALPWMEAVILVPINVSGLYYGGDVYIVGVLTLIALSGAIIALASTAKTEGLSVIGGALAVALVYYCYTQLDARITEITRTRSDMGIFASAVTAKVGVGLYVTALGNGLAVVGGLFAVGGRKRRNR